MSMVKKYLKIDAKASSEAGQKINDDLRLI